MMGKFQIFDRILQLGPTSPWRSLSFYISHDPVHSWRHWDCVHQWRLQVNCSICRPPVPRRNGGGDPGGIYFSRS